MRGVIFVLVLVAGCTSTPPGGPTIAPPAVTPAAAAAVKSAGAGTNPGLSAGTGANAGPTAGAGAHSVPIAATGANAVPTAGNAAHAASTNGAATNAATTDAAGRPVNRALVAQGYRPTTYRGQLYYCRKQKLTGSQFTHKVCLTEQEAALQERIAQDEMTKRNSQGKCLPPLCPKK